MKNIRQVLCLNVVGYSDLRCSCLIEEVDSDIWWRFGNSGRVGIESSEEGIDFVFGSLGQRDSLFRGGGVSILNTPQLRFGFLFLEHWIKCILIRSCYSILTPSIWTWCFHNSLTSWWLPTIIEISSGSTPFADFALNLDSAALWAAYIKNSNFCQ